MTADQGHDDLLIRADAAMKAAQWTVAIDYLRQLQTAGAGAEVDNALGICLARSGDPASAIRAFAMASHKAPGNAEFRFNLATAQKASGDLAAAQASFRALLAIAPEHINGWFNLGNTCLQLGQADAAVEAYEQAFLLRPDWAELCRNRAIALRESGRYEAALAAAREALADNPGDLALVRVIAVSLDRLGRSGEAADILAASPECSDIDLFAELSLNAGQTGQAIAALAEVYRSTGDSVWAIRKLLAHPPVVAGMEEVVDLRSRFDENLEALRTAGTEIADPLAAGLGPAFYPGYHGEDERERQIGLSTLYRSLCPGLNHVSASLSGAGSRPERLRVCFVSRHLVSHTIGQLQRGFIAGLDRRRFEVHVVGFAAPKDPVAQQIAGSADHFHIAPPDIAGACQSIESLKPDIIVYPDIGMEPLTYFLAHTRLAPVQCAAWGHPLTTGIDSIDYFISGAEFEAEDPTGHYSEKLFCLSGPATVYQRPAIQRDFSPEELGLDPTRRSYFCGQSLFKMQPDFDALLAGILRADEQGEVLLVEGGHASWSGLLRERFARDIPDVASRIRFLPRLGYDAFLSLTEKADVLLDTTQWSGGNTALESIALGQPMVMLPGRFMRGRISAGMYRVCGVTETICDTPEAYIRTAVRLAGDRSWRSEMQSRVRNGAGRLFERAECLRELERFFDDAYGSAS